MYQEYHFFSILRASTIVCRKSGNVIYTTKGNPERISYSSSRHVKHEVINAYLLVLANNGPGY